MIRPRLFLVAVFVTLGVLLVTFAASTVHSYDVIDRRDTAIGHLAAQVRALQHQLRRHNLVPVVPETPTTTPTTSPAARGRSARPATSPTSTTSTTSTTAPPSPPPTTCVLVVCTKGAS